MEIPVEKLFWWLLAVDAVAFLVLTGVAFRGPVGPNGMVGAWLLVIPVLVMAGFAVVAWQWPSEGVLRNGLFLLVAPWVMVAGGPLMEGWKRWETERWLRGDEDFRGAARELAHAIAQRDVAQVRTLLPRVKNLNERSGEQTLLLFAMATRSRAMPAGAPGKEASAEIVQLLLDAGADPNMPQNGTFYPLTAAMFDGEEMVKRLVRAGANPNVGERPAWWQALESGDRDLEMLRALLDGGADVKRQTPEGSVVGYAAHFAELRADSEWKAVWLLVERGAEWRGAAHWGSKVAEQLRDAVLRRHAEGREVSAEMRRLQELFRQE